MPFFLLTDDCVLRRVNDSYDADILAEYLARIAPPSRLHVNIVPYNPQSDPSFQRPDMVVVKSFEGALMRHGLFVKIRKTQGDDKMAACGQLGSINLRKGLRKGKREARRAEENLDW